MTRRYYVDWLRPRHARQIARLERKVYPPDYRAGYRSILEDLRVADADRTNLSVGIFQGRELVGFILAFYERDRRQICKYLDIEAPQSIDLSGPGIYFNDFVVHPKHRGAGGLLAGSLATACHTSTALRDLPVDTFSTEAMAQVWRQNAKFLSRVTLHLTQESRIATGSAQPLIWLSFRRVPRPRAATTTIKSLLKRPAEVTTPVGALTIGFIDSISDWSCLEPCWNRLLDPSANGTVFQSYEYLSTWWGLLGLRNELLIVVVLRGDEPIAIAPMQVSLKPWLRRLERCLGFIGHPSEVDRNTILGSDDHAVLACIADYLFDNGDLWECAALYEQASGSPFVKLLSTRLQAAGYIVTAARGPQCATVELRGTWDSFMAGRPKTFRKGVRRKLNQIAQNNPALETVSSSEDAVQALESYREIEAAGWKAGAGLGVARSPAHWHFYREVVERFGPINAVRFRFLRSANGLLAGTFGLTWRRTFYSLHIAHDPAHADLSPGFVLTALELKAAFEAQEFDTFDFLGGFMSNKRGWATAIAETIALFAHRSTWRGRLFHFIYFTVRPHLRQALIRLRVLDHANAARNLGKRLALRFAR